MLGSPTPPPTPGIPPPVRGFEPGQPSGYPNGHMYDIPAPPNTYWEWRGYNTQYPDPSQPGQPNAFNPGNLMIPQQGAPFYGESVGVGGDRGNNVAGVWVQSRVPSPYRDAREAQWAAGDLAKDEWIKRYRPSIDAGQFDNVPHSPYPPAHWQNIYTDPANMESARRHAASLYGEGMPLGDPMGRFSDALAKQRMDAAKKAGIKRREGWFDVGRAAGRQAAGIRGG